MPMVVVMYFEQFSLADHVKQFQPQNKIVEQKETVKASKLFYRGMFPVYSL